ncbi:MAG: hypothetical protein JSR98_15865 [Proteobacteria bacterium]|nr:hypothetical protein [Pseudomonadota bacterium]
MDTPGAELLERLRRADRAVSPVTLMLTDPAALEEALATQPDDLLAAIEANVAQSAGRHLVLVGPSFASAACDGTGRLVACDDSFSDWLSEAGVLESVVRDVAGARSRLTVVAQDRRGRPVALAAADWSLARNWPLSEAVTAALRQGTASHAVVAFRPSADGWVRAGGAFGLTKAELRVAQGLARHGQLRATCAAQGIAYETGRKLLASILRKVGARRQADALRALLAVVAGDTSPHRDMARVLGDLFALTDRQARLALAIANGATRDDAARALGLASHAAKDALKVVYDACGVVNAADLGRLLAEIEALSGLATACDVDVDAALSREPLRLIRRRWAEGHVAVSDHGPADGQPVVYCHAQMQGRHLPQVTVRALQAEGFRPIAVERAGFGLSDWVDGDFAEAGVRDLAEVLDALELDRVHALARGGVTPLFRFALANPGRVAGGLLLGIGLPASYDRPRTGISGLTKRLVFDHPRFMAPFVRALTDRTSNAAAVQFHRQLIRGSPPDERVLEDPALAADLIRAARQAAIGVDGFLQESLAHGEGMEPPRLADGSAWRVLVGGHDPVFDPGLASRYGRDLVPGATVEVVAEGGRWLHLSHPALVAKALRAVAG